MRFRPVRIGVLALVALALLPAPVWAVTKTVVFEVEGMVCGNCEATVERVVASVDGVVAVDTDRDSRLARVTLQDDQATPADVIAALHRAPYYRASLRSTAPAAPASAVVEAEPTRARTGPWVIALALARERIGGEPKRRLLVNQCASQRVAGRGGGQQAERRVAGAARGADDSDQLGGQQRTGVVLALPVGQR